MYILPNKFFEFIQARLAVAIGPSHEMTKLTREHDLGVISDSFDPANLAYYLNQLKSEEIYRFKLNSNNAAKILSFEQIEAKIKKMVDEIGRG